MNHIPSIEQQEMPAGALYMIGSPIGNLGDITYRAVHVLNTVDGIACEDTRHSSNLLNALGIHKPLMAIHEHNENEAAKTLLSKLRQGERWAYLCDAGTPGVSDPGARLTKELQTHGQLVIPIPGPSAVTTLFSVAGEASLSSDGRFQFLGFLPLKGKERAERLLQIDQSVLCSIVYESPQRVLSTLKDFNDVISDKNRMIVIGRELTKKFETISYVRISDLSSWVIDHTHLKGEFCILVEGAKKEPNLSTNDVLVNPMALALAMSEQLGSKQIAEILAKCYIMSKNDAYELALKIKNPPKGGL
jgi:16S rRNA (cytidine1402-2'-O)-methyltransferase